MIPVHSAIFFTFIKKRMIHKYAFLSLLLFTAIGCSSDTDMSEKLSTDYSYEKLNKAHWLLGDWQQQTEDGILLEHWERMNDSTYNGSSYMLIGKDTSSAESMVFMERGDTVTYIPTVRDQNNNQAVKFTLTKSGDSLLIFENPLHDFPQKISYELLSEDSILAEVSGKMEGKVKTISFPYVRVKPAL